MEAGDGGVGVLGGDEIGSAIAVEVAGGEADDGADLGGAGEWDETVATVGLAEEDAGGEVVRLEFAGAGEGFFAVDLGHGGFGEGVVLGEGAEHGG